MIHAPGYEFLNCFPSHGATEPSSVKSDIRKEGTGLAGPQPDFSTPQILVLRLGFDIVATGEVSVIPSMNQFDPEFFLKIFYHMRRRGCTIKALSQADLLFPDASSWQIPCQMVKHT
jgi:hypothetical protein